MDGHEQGPALVHGRMDIGGLARHAHLCPTEVEPGREQKAQELTDLDHVLDLLVLTGAARQAEGSYLLES